MDYNRVTLGVIPARAGSKSIPNKNIRPLVGKPLLVHSIEHALQAESIDRVIVSTDSEIYAEIACAAGAEVPFLRPFDYSQDDSTDLDVFLHLLQWLNKHEKKVPDLLVHLRPSYPVRDVADIDAMVQLALSDETIDSVRSVTPATTSPYKMWFMERDGELKPLLKLQGVKEPYNQPRQSLPQVYCQNACIDVVRSCVVVNMYSIQHP